MHTSVPRERARDREKGRHHKYAPVRVIVRAHIYARRRTSGRERCVEQLCIIYSIKVSFALVKIACRRCRAWLACVLAACRQWVQMSTLCLGAQIYLASHFFFLWRCVCAREFCASG